MAGDGKSISAEAVYAAQVLSVIQLTKKHLAELLKIDVDHVNLILEELRTSGLPLMSSFSQDNCLYYWMEKDKDS